MSENRRPDGWVCRICLKVDFADTEEQLAKPEHVAYRGVDLGKCKGKFLPFYFCDVEANLEDKKDE